jgi:hypothetical protein
LFRFDRQVQPGGSSKSLWARCSPNPAPAMT